MACLARFRSFTLECKNRQWRTQLKHTRGTRRIIKRRKKRPLHHQQLVRLGHVRSSSGKSRKRIFIETTAEIPGGFRWKILVSLADRSEMLCPMLLGRRALAGYFLIDPQGSHMLGQRRLLVNPTRHLLRTDHG